MRMTAWEKSRHPLPFPVANITLGLTFLGKSHVTKIGSWFGIVHSVRNCQFVIIKSFSMLILLVRCCLNMDVSAVHGIKRKPQFDGILPSGPYPPCYAWHIGPFWRYPRIIGGEGPKSSLCSRVLHRLRPTNSANVTTRLQLIDGTSIPALPFFSYASTHLKYHQYTFYELSTSKTRTNQPQFRVIEI